MDRSALETYLSSWKRQTYQQHSPLAALPLEIKRYVTRNLSLQSLARLSQCSKSWELLIIPELYSRDAQEGNSFAMKWAAAQAMDEETTEVALKILALSAKFGGQVNAIQREFPRQYGDSTLYETSTALHHAIACGNLRIAKRLLDMGARHDIPCSGPRWAAHVTDSPEWLQRRLGDFKTFYPGQRMPYSEWLPLFLAFIGGNHEMGHLLVQRGASRDAVRIHPNVGITIPISILHFAAANKDKDFKDWKFLFQSFASYISEACTEAQVTPLHLAVTYANAKAIKIAVQTGANMEARNRDLRTPLVDGVLQLPYLNIWSPRHHEHIRCLRGLVELGASVNPERDSVLIPAISYYKANPMTSPEVRHLIDFFLDHGADVNGSTMPGATAIQELILAIFTMEGSPSTSKVLKELMKELIKRGLDVSSPSRAIPSPLAAVMLHRNAQPPWLFKVLCENGATIHRNEVDGFFLHWCRQPRLWRGKRYDMWQHASIIAPRAVEIAYKIAFDYDDAAFYNILTRQPLALPSNEKLVKIAFFSKRRWGWKKIVNCKFAGCFVLTKNHENMLHHTIRIYETVPDYSTSDAIEDVKKLLKKGADITLQNIDGHDPLELFSELTSELASRKPGYSELLALLESEMEKAQDRLIKRQLRQED
ncbi:hypothetical protein E4U42_002457 [Claviceps africana]|uniref:F-box domain-containing protein n=1 Tax=Claviceps africana TaxID=83212 RepID=A0A8K0JD24_9HYPO|nr:hypothetical protein E4U42_002457 [Claviceps africana]